MYEYVQKSEYAPIRKELEQVIHRVQAEMKKKRKLSFQYRLIGSEKNHLITRIRGGNGGYDFDYNFIIPQPGNGNHYEACALKRDFMDAFRAALTGTPYSSPKDSTSAITIKVADKKEKRICHSCDIAILYYGNNGGDEGYYYLRHIKEKNEYQFAFRPLHPDMEEKAHAIIRHGGRNHIRDEYLNLKNINEGKEKLSFSLYTEAVNNVYNQMACKGLLP